MTDSNGWRLDLCITSVTHLINIRDSAVCSVLVLLFSSKLNDPRLDGVSPRIFNFNTYASVIIFTEVYL